MDWRVIYSRAREALAGASPAGRYAWLEGRLGDIEQEIDRLKRAEGIDYALWSKAVKPASREGFVDALLDAADVDEADSASHNPESPFGI